MGPNRGRQHASLGPQGIQVKNKRSLKLPTTPTSNPIRISQVQQAIEIGKCSAPVVYIGNLCIYIGNQHINITMCLSLFFGGKIFKGNKEVKVVKKGKFQRIAGLNSLQASMI